MGRSGGGLTGLSLRAIFWQAFWSDVLNPKVAIFHVALLPQVIDASAGHITQQLVLLGLTGDMLAFIMNIGLVTGAAQLTSRLGNDRVTLWLQRGMGVLFIGLGARIAGQQPWIG